MYWGKFVASFLILSLQSKAATTKISLMCITASSMVCGCFHGTTSDSHSRKFPGCTHPHTRKLKSGYKAVRGGYYTADTLSEVFNWKSVFGSGCICFLHGHSLSVCSSTPKLDTGFPCDSPDEHFPP